VKWNLSTTINIASITKCDLKVLLLLFITIWFYKLYNSTNCIYGYVGSEEIEVTLSGNAGKYATVLLNEISTVTNNVDDAL